MDEIAVHFINGRYIAITERKIRDTIFTSISNLSWPFMVLCRHWSSHHHWFSCCVKLSCSWLGSMQTPPPLVITWFTPGMLSHTSKKVTHILPGWACRHHHHHWGGWLGSSGVWTLSLPAFPMVSIMLYSHIKRMNVGAFILSVCYIKLQRINPFIYMHSMSVWSQNL